MNASSTLFRGVPMFEQAVNNDEISRSELGKIKHRYSQRIKLRTNSKLNMAIQIIGMIIREMGNLWEVALKLSLINELLQFHRDVPWDKPELHHGML